MVDPSPLAVIGMACRLPGAPDLDTYWNNIVRREYSIAPLSSERFDRQRYYDPEVGAYAKSYSDIGGQIDRQPFSPERIGLSPEAAATQDIAQLWSLDVALSAFADAGYDPDRTRGLNCGVVIGHARGSMLSSDISLGTAVEALVDALPSARLGADPAGMRRRIIEHAHRRYPQRRDDGKGTLPAALAGRISQHLGLTGRHMIVDAACASSFAALDVAASALARGSLDMALVGGASYSQTMSVVFFAQARALSADGSFPFDERANGFISSDGIGLLVIKRLEDALRDKDPIRAVIRGIGGSCDGKGKALWAPRKEGQVLAIERAYEGLDFDAGSLGLIEAHATSTQLGDATEVEALSDVLAPRIGATKIPIGSVKGNIGHTRETAGAAGLIKTILALQHQTLPPTGNYRSRNPSIAWDTANVEVQTEAAPWRAGPQPRRAGVDAFGIGGLNFHVVVEEAPPAARTFSSSTIEPRPTEAPAAIAIVGVGGRFPEADSVGQFWNNLLAKKDSIHDVPEDRWNKAIYLERGGPKAHRSYTARGGFIRDFSANWRRYKIPPKLVERTDPLQFMLLEAAMDAFDDAGLDLDRLDKARTGVVVGTSFGSDYQLDLSLGLRAREVAEEAALALGRADDSELIEALATSIRERLPSINEDSSGSISSSTLASRISKTLDLMGPTFSIDASCASSLASLEASIDLLTSGQVDVAVFGGGDRSMNVQRYESYCHAEALSHKDCIRPFDASADGFLPGESAAVCILKRLEDAQRDGDHVYAVIRGVGSSTERLDLAMQRALRTARVDASHVGFIECHGAGDKSSDEQEAEALGRVYLAKHRARPLTIGSVKGNVGHTQGAAGAVSMLKAALSIEHGVLPPTLHHQKPRAGLEQGVHINQNPEPFPTTGPKRCAAVSAISQSGACYHVVLEGLSEHRAEAVQSVPLAISERPIPTTESATILMSVHPWIHRVHASTIEDLRVTLAQTEAQALFDQKIIGRGPAVATFVADNPDALAKSLALLRKAGLRSGAEQLTRAQGVFVRERPADDGKRAFLFSGQGSQYGGMLRAVHDSVPAARLVLARIDTWLHARGRSPISAVMFGSDIPESVFLVQASILAADLMSYEALVGRRVTPDFVTGHSYGDYAALVAAGAWSVEEALEATVIRAEAIEATVEGGGMMSAAAPLSDVHAAIQGLGQVFPSNINAPNQTVLSGSAAGLDAATAALDERGIETKRLAVPRPFHSPLMSAAAGKLREGLARIPMRAPTLSYLSSITGEFESDPDRIRESLIDQLTEPVDFLRQIHKLVDAGARVFIEAGPRGTLASLATQIIAAKNGGLDADVIASDDKQRPGPWALTRVQALLETRRKTDESELPHRIESVSSGLSDDEIVEFLGDDAYALRGEPGFEDFFRSTIRPRLVEMTRLLWEEEKATRPPESAVEVPSVIETPPEPEPLSPPSALVPATVTSIVPSPARGPSSAPARSELEAFLLRALCEETGYPEDIIELDADLEADLGIDTVKQAQVLGKLRDEYQLSADPNLTLADVPTVTHIVDYIEQRFEHAPPALEAPAVTLPTVDITARRSARPEPKAPPQKTPARPATAAPAPRATFPPAPTAKPSQPPPGIAIGARAPTPQKESSSRVTVVRLSGTAGEIGRQHGTLLKTEILELLKRYESLASGHGLGLKEAARLAKNLETVFSAATREEIAGIAEAVELPYEYILAYNLDAALYPSFTPGCTQAFVSGEAPLHFVNEDSPLLIRMGGALPRIVQIRDRSDGPDERRTVHFSLAGQVAGPNAVSDNGLSITSCALLDAPSPSKIPSGTPHPEIVKQIIDEANDLEHAVSLAKGAHGTGRWSMVISDGTRAHFLEYDHADVLHEQSIGDRFVSTNHAISGPARGMDAPQHSVNRRERAEVLLTDATGVDAAKRLLRDRYDTGRGREVQHATMNTIRRVDNIMSLVIEPTERRFHVTDRVVSSGSLEEPEFMTISYGKAEEAPARRPAGGTESDALDHPAGPSAIEPIFDGLTSIDETMRRNVTRLVVAEPPDKKVTFAPNRVLLLGSDDRAKTLADRLRERGSEVVLVEQPENVLEVLGSHGGPDGFDAVGVVLPPHKSDSLWSLRPADWETRRKAVVDAPFSLFRAYVPARPHGAIFCVTTMGGSFGYENHLQGSPEDGGLIGLFKALRHEFPELQVQALDVSNSATPEQVSDALLTELDAGSPLTEIGLLRKKRMRPVLVERRIDQFEGTRNMPKTWLVTGGARGVTAKVAARLARLYRPELHLVGRHVLPDESELRQWRALDDDGLAKLKASILEEMKSAPDFTPIDWQRRIESMEKAIEIDQTLRTIEGHGAKVHYHSVDLKDADAVRKMIEDIGGAQMIEGVIHGAGVEIAKPFEKKTDEILDLTLGGKVDGLIHLLRALQDAPPSHIIGFSSVSGRFGGHGQADYSLANEMLTKILGRYAYTHPSVRVSAIAWPAWGEVGLAARSSAKSFLEAAGQTFMSPEEGANHLVREIWAGLPELEVTICDDLAVIDRDHQLPAPERAELREQLAGEARRHPLLGELILATPETTIFEKTLDSKEPFLDQHRIGPVPLLPGVVGLEILAELVMVAVDRKATLGNVEIHLPLKLGETKTAIVRAKRTGKQLTLSHTAVKRNGLVLEPERVHMTGEVMERRQMPMPLGLHTEGDLVHYPYPDDMDRSIGSRLIFHGPVFRCLEGVSKLGDDRGVARLVVPPVQALVRGSRAEDWLIPAALLDGCLQATGLLGRMLFNTTALPIGFGRIDVAPRAVHATGEPVTLEIQIRRKGAKQLESDLLVLGADGPLLYVEQYRAQAIPGAPL